MRDWLLPPLRIALAHDGVTILQPGSLLTRMHTVLADDPITPEEVDIDAVLPACLASVLDRVAASAKRAHVILSDNLVRYFIVTPLPNSSKLGDCRAAAQMRFQQLYAECADDWTIVAKWDALRPYLACAIRKPLITDLHTVLDSAGLRVESVVPHFVAIWNARQPSTAWVVTVHGAQLTIGVVAHGSPVAVRAVIASSEVRQDPTWLSQQIESEALRLGVVFPSAVEVFGDVPDAWLAECASNKALRFPMAQHKRARTDSITPGTALALAGMR